jgi:hypothetical protein
MVVPAAHIKVLTRQATAEALLCAPDAQEMLHRHLGATAFLASARPYNLPHRIFEHAPFAHRANAVIAVFADRRKRNGHNGEAVLVPNGYGPWTAEQVDHVLVVSFTCSRCV